jgi:ParB-like chromosome segregation protein Spo0J
MKKDLLKPVSNVEIVDIDKLKANDYNPNKVNENNLKLLKNSILENGWTLPIVVRPDYTIIDGFHRWTVAKREPLVSMLNKKVPVVIVKHEDKAKDIYGTITHNRARGEHLLSPMENIIKSLLEEGKDVDEIKKQLGMSYEEVFRLSGLNKDKFLERVIGGKEEYSQAKVILRY